MNNVNEFLAMKINCPLCAKETELEPVEGLVKCEQCGEWFHEPPRAPDTPPQNSLAEAYAKNSVVRELELRRQKIHRQANSFSLVAALCVGLGLLGLFFAIQSVSIGSDIFCGAAFGLALWLYLIAQIIHIRANTEK
jgi:ribosomal protein L37AE/L43A